MTKIALYTKDNIGDFKWLEHQQYEKHYILPLIKEGANSFIANVKTEVALLQVDDILFPITINNEEYESSYVCSPYNACISYSKEEMAKLGNKPLELVLQTLANLSGSLLKAAKINKVVSINNWLLSTNLYQKWNGHNIAAITDFLMKRFPGHVIMSRSLNQQANNVLLEEYRRNGYDFVPSRQVYLFDKKNGDYTKKNNTKWDFNLLENTQYKIVSHEEITAQDYPRITELYNQLYLEKYSYHNPQFNVKCIEQWHKHKLIVMQGLRNAQGRLDGIAGCFERNDITTAPLVGYDTSLPQSLGLYRMLIALVIKRAHIEHMSLNASSGASEFKRLRGGVPEIEYSVIYTKHLSLFRKGVWKILTWLLVNIGVVLMKKYKL